MTKRDGKGMRHVRSDDLYTPITPQVHAWMDQMRREYGSWSMIAAVCDMRIKSVHNIRYKRDRWSISLRTMDKMMTATGIGNLNDFVWFRAEDMVRHGIWKPWHLYNGPPGQYFWPGLDEEKWRVEETYEDEDTA